MQSNVELAAELGVINERLSGCLSVTSNDPTLLPLMRKQQSPFPPLASLRLLLKMSVPLWRDCVSVAAKYKSIFMSRGLLDKNCNKNRGKTASARQFANASASLQTI